MLTESLLSTCNIMLSRKHVLKYLVDELLQDPYLSMRMNPDVTCKCLQMPATCSYHIYFSKRNIYATDTYFVLLSAPRVHQDLKTPKAKSHLNLVLKSRLCGEVLGFLELLL